MKYRTGHLFLVCKTPKLEFLPILPNFATTLTVHIPVMLDEVLDALGLQPGKIIVDATLGGGGHSREILKRIGPGGMLIAIDRDPDAVVATEATLVATAQANDVRLSCHPANYADLPELLAQLQIATVDGILLDLGLSSDQLEDRNRGFSYHADGALDLRFNRNAGEPAARLVNRLGEKHLADLIYEFGEEKFSRRVARNICKQRHIRKIETAAQLADIVRRSVPRSKNHPIDPATRTFQALRIAVNEELKWLTVAMRRLPDVLSPGGRLAVISFHSLEDRIVKTAFLENPKLEIITKRPIRPTETEVESNARSRSAKLRVAKLK
jgi:16S rRNA (cytosine1402-N4)-methyltransferase